ncbi:serine/arginine repetitive matrix protein 2-like [Oncorhynchus masou masou]|uniref:serine/arginine repetitive matrix protein 2-like n=1 Tax=Oncorhynchus masou masou TaxID=90313 RepID=UPI0031830987
MAEAPVQSSDTVAKDSDATATEPSPVVMDLMTTNDDQSQTAAKPDGENGETIATATVHAATVAGSAPVTSASVPVARPVSVKGEDKLFNFSPVTQEILKALEAAVHQHRLGRQAEEQRQDQGEKDKPPSDKKSSVAGEKGETKTPAGGLNQAPTQPEKKTATQTQRDERSRPALSLKKNKLQPEKSQTDKKPPTKPAKKTTTQTEGAKKPPSGSGQPKKNQGKTQVYGGRGRRRDHSSPEKRDSSRHRSSRAASEEEEQGPPTSRHGDSSRSSSGSCRSNRQDGSPAKKKGRKEEEERSKGHHSRTSQSSRSESRDQEAAESKGFGYVVDEFTSDVNPSDANPIDLDQFNMDEFVTVDEVEGDEADNANPPESSSSSPNPPEPSTSSPNTQDGTYGRSERSSKRKRGTPDTPISTMKSSQEKERPLSKSTPTPSSSTSTPWTEDSTTSRNGQKNAGGKTSTTYHLPDARPGQQPQLLLSRRKPQKPEKLTMTPQSGWNRSLFPWSFCLSQWGKQPLLSW